MRGWLWVRAALLIAATSACATRGTESARMSATPASPATEAAGAPATRAERLAQLDAYLQSWDALARGDRAAAALVVDAQNRARFEQTLTALMRAGDRAAPARLVFYQAVQIYSVVRLDSPLGAAAHDLLGESAFGANRGDRQVYTSADLYRWWKNNQAKYEPLPLLERWENWAESRDLIAGWLKPRDPAAAPATAEQAFAPADEATPGTTALPKDVIRSVISSHISEVRRCYEAELDDRAVLEGRVEVRFVIAPLGVVAVAAVKRSDLGNPFVEKCIVDAVRTWLFPRPEGGGIVVVTYPFVLRTVTDAKPSE